MERFYGFRIDRCAPETLDLCVTAHFSRDPGPGPSSVEIRIRTGLSDVRYPPRDFPLREILIQAYTVVS
jgi:hypothetical protein